MESIVTSTELRAVHDPLAEFGVQIEFLVTPIGALTGAVHFPLLPGPLISGAKTTRVTPIPVLERKSAKPNSGPAKIEGRTR